MAAASYPGIEQTFSPKRLGNQEVHLATAEATNETVRVKAKGRAKASRK